MFGKVKKGYRLLSINGEVVQDSIDFRYKLSEESAQIVFEDQQGKMIELQLNQEYAIDLGLRFEDDKILTCKNKCIFCFVHQQPKGLRRALYIRDDDYRLSFTHGNFISFSNLTKDDMERIISQRLSPLYVSVHTTDDNLRREMFGNPKLPAILPQLKQLIDKGIRFHTQVVVCPGINDGAHLDKTLDDLFSLYHGVISVGVVPVGVTKYRHHLPGIKSFDERMAGEILQYIHTRQREILGKSGSRFVFAADEFYILAKWDFPSLVEYEEMAQFENGIGMMRMMLTDFNRRKRFLKKIKRNPRAAIFTGESAFGAIKDNIIQFLNNEIGLNIDLIPVENEFWGKSVTVSGLLTGQDILRKLESIRGKYEMILLPPNCLNSDSLFLDDMSFAELEKGGGTPVFIGKYSMVDTIMEALK